MTGLAVDSSADIATRIAPKVRMAAMHDPGGYQAKPASFVEI